MESTRSTASRSSQNAAPGSPALHQEGRPSTSKPKPHYTVFIRLPFPRNDFKDPPPVEWDANKDRQLWKVISTASNSKDLDWEAMSARFNVSLPFLLQQAAWLYERHFEGMKAQMKKLSVPPSVAASGTASPAPVQGEGGVKLEGSAAIGSVGMQRKGSKEGKSPSSNVQKGSPLLAGDLESSPPTPRSYKPMISRTPSTTTLTQSRVLSSPRNPFKPSGSIQERPSSGPPLMLPQNQGSILDAKDQSDTDSEDEPSMIRSQAFRRPPVSKKFASGTLSSDADAEDDDEDSPGGYLPFAAQLKSSKDDPAATLKSSPKRQGATVQPASTSKGKVKEPAPLPDSSASPASSAQPPPATTTLNDTGSRPGRLSPRYRAELEKLSPRHRKSGSEGSPSMGSSFSDLDDASVTQSALEQALMSNMQHGSVTVGMGSRISGLREALGRK